ncbi:unnamed protein product [Durusdinium trenchii]|uniref:Uncharacterized protein n=1 Tax=Durusdinium trenchii TaxID=1381693 RepID=A0ABP0S4R3_9DINO
MTNWVTILTQVQAPKVFVAIVLLLSWNDAVSFDRGFQFLEVFSGQGNVSKKMHRLGYSVASIDFDYSNKHMDFLNVSGFLLAIYVLMNMAPRGLTLWAPVCGSWGLPCRHTSGRSIINIAGNTCYQFVRDGNLMISRLTLGLLLVTALNLFWLLEQPSQSLLQHHKRYEWFCNRVAWVFQTHFWLMHHGSKSAKRTVFYGNLSTMNHLDKGVLSKKEKELKTKVSTTRSYRDQNGVKRFVGKKEELKSTQSYPERLGDSIHELYVEELRLDMDHQLKSGVDFVMSPTAHMTWADEDFIGVKEEMEVAVGAIIRISPGHHVHTSDFVKTGVGYHSTHHDPTTMNILLPEKLASKGNTSSIDDNALHTGRISAAAIQKTLEALPAPRLTNLMSIPFCDWVLKIQIPVLPRVIPHPRRYTCPPK